MSTRHLPYLFLPVVELQMEQPDGSFATFRTIRPDFGSAEVVFFYGTADGTVADPFDKPKSFPGDKFLTLTVALGTSNALAPTMISENLLTFSLEFCV